jgi:predicted RNA-binding Zn-ribbon protein involved in translation (DUF1610 family)
MIAKTSCQHCGIHIEFETDNAQENVPCPLCGGKTEWRGDNAKPVVNRPDTVQSLSEIHVKPASRALDLASVAPEVERVVEADTTITTAAALNHVPKPKPEPEPAVAAEQVVEPEQVVAAEQAAEPERVLEPEPIVEAPRAIEQPVEKPAEPMRPAPVVPRAPAPAKRLVERPVEREEMLRLGPKARRAPLLDALTFASALNWFAGIALVCAVVGGVVAGASDRGQMMLGLEIFTFGILVGLVLVGFGCLVEYTKAGLDRLERLEAMIEKIANDQKSH